MAGLTHEAVRAMFLGAKAAPPPPPSDHAAVQQAILNRLEAIERNTASRRRELSERSRQEARRPAISAPARKVDATPWGTAPPPRRAPQPNWERQLSARMRESSPLLGRAMDVRAPNLRDLAERGRRSVADRMARRRRADVRGNAPQSRFSGRSGAGLVGGASVRSNAPVSQFSAKDTRSDNKPGGGGGLLDGAGKFLAGALTGSSAAAALRFAATRAAMASPWVAGAVGAGLAAKYVYDNAHQAVDPGMQRGEGPLAVVGGNRRTGMPRSGGGGSSAGAGSPSAPQVKADPNAGTAMPSTTAPMTVNQEGSGGFGFSAPSPTAKVAPDGVIPAAPGGATSAGSAAYMGTSNGLPNSSSALRNANGTVISTADTTLPAYQRAFLDTVSHYESRGKGQGYDTLVGGGRIASLDRHPNVVGLTTELGGSTAAGRYQFLGSTWNSTVKQYNAANPDRPITDFSPQAQDRAAYFLAQQNYRTRTNGRDLDTDLKNKEYGYIRYGLGGWGRNTTWQGFQGKSDIPQVMAANLERNEKYASLPSVQLPAASPMAAGLTGAPQSINSDFLKGSSAPVPADRKSLFAQQPTNWPSVPTPGTNPNAPVITGGSRDPKDLKLSGGPGGQATAGGQAHPGTMALVTDVQNMKDLPGGLKYFSAINDSFHKGSGSHHAKGRAFDAVLQDGSRENYAAATQKVVEHLRAAGFDIPKEMNGRSVIRTPDLEIINEQASPSAGATGAHLHVALRNDDAAEKYRLYSEKLEAERQAAAAAKGQPAPERVAPVIETYEQTLARSPLGAGILKNRERMAQKAAEQERARAALREDLTKLFDGKPMGASKDVPTSPGTVPGSSPILDQKFQSADKPAAPPVRRDEAKTDRNGYAVPTNVAQAKALPNDYINPETGWTKSDYLNFHQSGGKDVPTTPRTPYPSGKSTVGPMPKGLQPAVGPNAPKSSYSVQTDVPLAYKSPNSGGAAAAKAAQVDAQPPVAPGSAPQDQATQGKLSPSSVAQQAKSATPSPSPGSGSSAAAPKGGSASSASAAAKAAAPASSSPVADAAPQAAPGSAAAASPSGGDSPATSAGGAAPEAPAKAEPTPSEAIKQPNPTPTPTPPQDRPAPTPNKDAEDKGSKVAVNDIKSFDELDMLTNGSQLV